MLAKLVAAVLGRWRTTKLALRLGSRRVARGVRSASSKVGSGLGGAVRAAPARGRSFVRSTGSSFTALNQRRRKRSARASRRRMRFRPHLRGRAT
ncbi:hypothetical protein SACE_4297 [Saccharopolyspora erythraea NRRL 2338]|uniref:Uncharacterized protein n=1 Tax=Saccharopolyspora erythraea (strain ATCC 11635 / DSM 40517 / JCM 4748 / NBRC 13426 / NCIMB 8594 / NRRL 2338) TaxID=405948 RepID=A4FHP1_SACEN|nr:hypothetical protein SACE_4297 [Saccharopolyspora erythraea NRRL 2338]